MFYPSSAEKGIESIKVNHNEAVMVAKICNQIVNDMIDHDHPITEKSIGIITPFRAQIAAIRKELFDALPENYLKKITIDTVERYQGGARDIIVMSTCMNYNFQMAALVSISEDGIDRKMNVAITRAKEQFILVGNPDILNENPTYRALIDSAELLNI